jgi:putative phosphotransacetylase
MEADKAKIKRIVDIAVATALAKGGKFYVPVAVSNRHMHICQEDIEKLFGKGYSLSRGRELNQPGQYASEEKVTVIGPKGKIENVRILGPIRKETQVEVSLTDAYKLGIEPMIRMSGDLIGTPGCKLAGPMGETTISRGVILSARHLHLSAEEASVFGLKNKDVVRIRMQGVRALVFENVVVRSGEGHSMEMHIDTDEANAAGITCGQLLELIRQ